MENAHASDSSYHTSERRDFLKAVPYTVKFACIRSVRDAAHTLPGCADGLQWCQNLSACSWPTCADLQVRLKALWRHCIWQNDILETIAQLSLHQRAVLLQFSVQKVLHMGWDCLLHLQQCLLMLMCWNGRTSLQVAFTGCNDACSLGEERRNTYIAYHSSSYHSCPATPLVYYDADCMYPGWPLSQASAGAQRAGSMYGASANARE